MYYIVETDKPFARATADLEAAVERHGYGVLHVHDLGNTLRAKGVDFTEDCKVLEVCNPHHAAEVLAADMRLNMALPCRISVYTEGGRTKLGLIEPVQMLSALSDDEALRQVAMEVQEKTMRMIDEAR